MILGGCHKRYCGVKWVQVIFVILLHSPPPPPPQQTQRSQQMAMQNFGGKDGGKTEMWLNTQAKRKQSVRPIEEVIIAVEVNELIDSLKPHA